MWQPSENADLNYLAGIFDGEGWIVKSGQAVGFAQNPGLVLEKCKKILDEHYLPGYRVGKKSGNCLQLMLKGSRSDKLTFLGRIKAVRLLSKDI